MVISSMLRNIKDTGHPLRVRIWSLLSTNVWHLGFSDLAMVLSTGINLPLHRVFKASNGWLRWFKGGIIVQSLFEAIWLAFWVSWPFLFGWTWTAQVFLTLHTLTFFMKMHSYAFYNGYLSETLRRLSALDNPSQESRASAYKYPSPRSPLKESLDQTLTSDRDKEKQEQTLKSLREDLAFELTSPLGQVTYPNNLTLYNYVDYVLCPTLCYELEYPRTEGVRFMELFSKVLAIFGCIFLLIVVSEDFILPVMLESAFRLENVQILSEAGLILAESVSQLLFPFMVTFLLVFLVIFEYVLGAMAEITCFADRHFYSDWWNSTEVAGLSSLENGTFQSTTSSVGTYIVLHDPISHGKWLPLSPF
ncbi:MAG: hypothetical protein M1829_003475 [Trizodia sp. TS-e1964]|nr:MAG: hypothetical protein M1829_003475 [Trizodia sp. TS-e1964]